MKYIVDMHDEKMNIVTCISTDNCHSISDAARNTEKLLEYYQLGSCVRDALDLNRGQEDTPMKYTKDQRLDMGRRIYEGEISRFEAATEYGIGSNTAREYMRLYRAEHHLPVRHVESNAEKIKEPPRPPARMEDYEAMSKEELIQELVRAKIVEARLKKDTK